jgi:hypothetical protein
MTVSPHWGQLKVVLPLSTSRTPQDEQLTALATIVNPGIPTGFTNIIFAFLNKL